MPAEAGAPAGSRHQARERALGLLYEAELKQVAVEEVLGGLAAQPDPYALSLVRGVVAHQARIDELVGAAARGWELERMPVVDRALLRMATYELLAEPGVPVSVVIDEAVELAGRYSTDDSGRFVNGVLATVAAAVRDG